MVPKTFPFPPTEGGYVLKRLNPSDAHRHQHIEGRAAVVFADQGRGGGVGQVQFHQVAVDLAKNVQQIAGVEADVETLALEGAGDFLRRRAVFGAGDGQGTEEGRGGEEGGRTGRTWGAPVNY